MSADETCRRIAAAHHAVVTRDQARAAGLTLRQIRQRIAAGEWRRCADGVYALTGAPLTRRQEMLVATLALNGVASHGSAAWLHELEERAPNRPHVLRSSNFGTRSDQWVLHRCDDLLGRDVTSIDSIATTSATRTLIDLAAVRSDQELRALIDRARRHGLTHSNHLIARFLSTARRGRPGTARLRRILTELDGDLSLAESDLETLLLEIVNRHGLPAPLPQYRIRIGDSDYRIDLAYPDQRVAIEGDGFEFHARRDRFEDDRVRQNDLVLAGWRVLRFTWRQLVRRPEYVSMQISAALSVQV